MLTSEMVRGINASIEMDICTKCGGSWFDKDELAKIDKITEPVAFEFRRLPKQQEQMETLKCPHCNPDQLLLKAVHPRDVKVILDFCPGCHGIWLDRGELNAIQRENWLITVKKLYSWLKAENQN
jgi:Zn-finger nucleic acid-binding protein